MSRKTILGERSLKALREAALQEIEVEDDEYTIGAEKNAPIGGVYCHALDENNETEVSSSEVSLKSFKKRQSLEPHFFSNPLKIDSKARLKLLDIADDFIEYLNLPWVKPKGIVLIGSIVGYNYSESSDIDLHIILDFSEVDERTDFVKEYVDSKKNEWNETHNDILIYGYKVELYVQDINEEPTSNGIYDLEDDSWIQQPSEDDGIDIGLDKYSIKDKAAEIMTIIDGMYDSITTSDDSFDNESIGKDAIDLLSKIKSMRRSSLKSKGEGGARKYSLQGIKT